MNKLQRDLCKVIQAIASIEDFEQFGQNSAIRYGFLNYVAKYSLAADTYFATPIARAYLEENGFLTKRGLRRGRKSKANGFTYEHAIPANVVADEILRKPGSADHIATTLLKTDVVTILTTEENEMLSGPLRAKMPDGWVLESGDIYARYTSIGLVASHAQLHSVSVYGAIAR
jgi:hypothetical protein